MCLSCGCGKAHTDHGNKANITYEDLAAAARVNGGNVNEVLKAINSTVVSDRVKHETEYDTYVE